jgi:NADH:ubiquinone oxidoreductase subunit B-like Fe-S oxidoreductase
MIFGQIWCRAFKLFTAPGRSADGNGYYIKKNGSGIRQVYLQMAEPRWVMAVGACASSGGIFDTYSVLQGIDEVIPVDVYVPGCPPRPEAIIDGFINTKIGTNRISSQKK